MAQNRELKCMNSVGSLLEFIRGCSRRRFCLVSCVCRLVCWGVWCVCPRVITSVLGQSTNGGFLGWVLRIVPWRFFLQVLALEWKCYCKIAFSPYLLLALHCSFVAEC